MPVIAEVVDHDELYERLVAQGIEPIIINDLPSTTEADKERIKELTITQLSSDTISIVPTCGGTVCNQATRGKYNLGKTCPICGNVVRSTIEDSARSLLWLRAPEGVERLINPIALNFLSSYFSKGQYDAIAWLTDSAYSPTGRMQPEIEKLMRLNHTRDLNYFTENFDRILEDLIDIFPEKPQKPHSELREWVRDNRKALFPKKIPLPSKNLFIMDKTIVGIYMELSIQEALDTIYHFVSIDRDFHDRTPRVIMNRTARGLLRQAKFYHSYLGTNFQPKPGHFRRQVYGSRSNWAARAVIVSETGRHKYDEVGVPWRIAVPMFQHHLMGKLMRHGYIFNDALEYVLSHVGVYDPLIHQFLDEIFQEFPGGRGPVMILHRNPTLLQGSAQRYFAYLKTDPTDPCISMSILTVVAPNA